MNLSQRTNPSVYKMRCRENLNLLKTLQFANFSIFCDFPSLNNILITFANTQMKQLRKRMKLRVNIFPPIILMSLWITFIMVQPITDISDKYPTFKQFVSKFNKSYNLKAEYQRRQEIYNQNIQHIRQSNCESERVNFYTDWTQDELNQLKNAQQNQQKQKVAAMLIGSERRLSQSLPIAFDWRNLIQMTEVKDAGYCGAGYAFSTIAYFQQYNILAGVANASINLSQMFILGCSPQNTACTGGNVESSIDLILNTGGIPYENNYLYNPITPPSPSICFETNTVKTQQNISRMSYYNVNDPEFIKLLLQDHPIIVAICAADLPFYAPQNAESNESGSRTLKCNPRNRVIDHAVLLVGYTQTEWIVKNSWGNKWGLNGYAYISRNPAQDCCIGDELHTTGLITTNCSVQYCQTCVQTTTCSKCQAGRYVFYNTTTGVQACELCREENCLECYNYMGSCKWCGDGYAINKTSGKCVPSTIAYCNTLKKGNCIQCKPGYILATNKLCSLYCSVINCVNCTTGTCTACRLGYSLFNTTTTNSNGKNIQYCILNNCSVGNCSYCDSTGTICLQCKYSYLLNTTTSTCYTNCTIINCINCLNASTTCNQCVPGLSYNSTSKLCQNFTATTNCKIHKIACTTCRTGYTLSSGKCVQNCNSACLTCLQSNPYYCLTCPLSSYLSTETYASTCIANPCSVVNCKSCYANATCMTCTTKYLVYNSTSNKCESQCALPNCRDCLPNATVCAHCQPGYAVSSSTRLCIQSNITNCVVADSLRTPQVCYTCEPNYYLSTASTECFISCTDYYCESCNLSTLFICTKCFDGFFMIDLYGGRTCTYIQPIIPRCYYVSYNQSYCYLCDEYSVWNPTTGSCEHNTTSCPQFCQYCGNNQVSTFICRCKQQGYVFDIIKHICIPNPMSTTLNCTIVELYAGVYYCLQCTEGLIPDKNNINCISPCTVLNCTYCGTGFPTICVQCNVGYYLDESNQCQRCMANCKTCVAAKCTSCQNGFQLSSNGQSCLPIICKDGYLFDGYQCTCPPGTYYANLTCLPCGQVNCNQCTQQQCFSCQQGYLLSQHNQCLSCPVNCKRCNTQSSCIVCQDGYVLDSSTMLCVNPALSGPSFSVSSTAVVKCPLNCMQCNNQSICKQCAPAYTVVGNICMGCQGACKTCYPGNVSACLSCTNGYYLDGLQCVKCSVSNCFNCELMASICVMCNDGFYLNNGGCVPCTGKNCIGCNYADQCTKCSSGYALLSDFTCQQCGCDCRSCNSTAINQCIVMCNTTSYLSNNECVSCPSQCQTCTSASICLSCSINYILQNTTCRKPCPQGCYICDPFNPSKCLQCIVGYYLTANNICDIDIACNENYSCTTCPKNWSLINGSCQMCNTDDNCVQCANNNVNFCVECKIGFFVFNGICVPCSETCFTCSQQDRCLLCKDGFYLPTNVIFANCLTCDPMCKTCVEYTDKCTSCNAGYELTVTDKCLRVQKVNCTVQLNLAIENFPRVSGEIRSAVIGLMGAQFQNETKLYIITGLKQGSTILTFTVSIPEGQNPATLYNTLKEQLTTARELGGTQVIAVMNIGPINIIFEPNNTINNNTNNNNNSTPNQDNNRNQDQLKSEQKVEGDGNTQQIAIILGVAIPAVVIGLLIGGYFIKKKYFENKIQNESELEFKEVDSETVNQAKLTSQESNGILVSPFKEVDFDHRLDVSKRNQTYFDTTQGQPNNSFSTLNFSTNALKNTTTNKTSPIDKNPEFDRTLHNIVSTLNNQDQISSQLSISNNQNIIKEIQDENFSEIKNEKYSNPYPTIREVMASNNQADGMFFPQEHHNHFFQIEDSFSEHHKNIDSVKVISMAINPRPEVFDFKENQENSQF